MPDSLERYKWCTQEAKVFRKRLWSWFTDHKKGGELGQFFTKAIQRHNPWLRIKLSKLRDSRLLKGGVVVFVITIIGVSLKQEPNKPIAEIIFDNLESIALGSAGVVFLLDTQDRKKRDHYEAWQVINTAQGQTGSGGRIQALEDLCKDNVDLEGIDISNAELSGIDLSFGKLSRANLQKAQLDGATLIRAHLIYTKLDAANLSGADLSGADLSRNEVINRNTTLTKANLSNAILRAANLSGANFRNADLSGTDFRNANLSSAIFSHANLSGANLNGANLNRVNLAGSTISNQTKIDKKWRLVHKLVHEGGAGQDLSGVDLSNTHLTNMDVYVDLSNANLSGANLSNSYFHYANLSNANLSGANLSNSYFSNANLSNANLNHANLSNSNPNRVNLSCADLSNADFSGAILDETQLNEANLSNVNFSDAYFSNVNLNGAILSGANLSNLIVLTTNLRNTKQLSQKQFSDERPPLLLNVLLPENLDLKNLKDQDCKTLATVLSERYPRKFKFQTVTAIKAFLENERQKSWELKG